MVNKSQLRLKSPIGDPIGYTGVSRHVGRWQQIFGKVAADRWKAEGCIRQVGRWQHKGGKVVAARWDGGSRKVEGSSSQVEKC